jgi:hypothetical protein
MSFYSAVYAAIQKSELCLVDWTGWRPNVFFELGVRIAVNEIDPVQTFCEEAPPNWPEKVPWPSPPEEADDLERFFGAVPFSTADTTQLEQRIRNWRDADFSLHIS